MLYKLRRISTGLFSNGGLEPDFSEEGKYGRKRSGYCSISGIMKIRGPLLFQSEAIWRLLFWS